MRKTFMAGTVAALLATSAAALAGVAPISKPAGPAVPGMIGGGGPGNSTAYERAITAYLDNVVEKARKKLPDAPVAQPHRRKSRPMGPGYPGSASIAGGSSHSSLPRVERITIGIKARAVLETPSGGMLRVSPGVVTPYGQVTRIRAAGVWFRMHGSRDAVELADISPDGGPGKDGQNPQQGVAAGQDQMGGVPPPPNFQPAPSR
ncbi:MAG: hypothetical protein ACYCV6_01495 [Steroidobacteraceae bacterium]